LQEVGQNVSNNLVEQFEKQVTNLNADVDKFESELKQWEFNMQSELSDNNAAITAFNNDVDFSQQAMSQSLNSKFRVTQEYQEKVRERMDALEQTVYKPAN
jgi:outer membrane murein-binding lipoprotein Lpp